MAEGEEGGVGARGSIVREGSFKELVTAIMIIIGGVVFFASVFYRAPNAPSVPSFNPKHWTPTWKQQSHLRGPGCALMRWGLHIFGFGVLLRLIFLGWDSWGF
jgi:hypothetical protein